MNYTEWAFHDLEPVYLQLIQKNRVFNFEQATSCGRRTPFYSDNGKIIKNQPQYRNESIYASKKKQLNYFFQKWTLFCD